MKAATGRFAQLTGEAAARLGTLRDADAGDQERRLGRKEETGSVGGGRRNVGAEFSSHL
jgi:hypothetical protein